MALLQLNNSLDPTKSINEVVSKDVVPRRDDIVLIVALYTYGVSAMKVNVNYVHNCRKYKSYYLYKRCLNTIYCLDVHMYICTYISVNIYGGPIL